jgi:hypothetical protein
MFPAGGGLAHSEAIGSLMWRGGLPTINSDSVPAKAICLDTLRRLLTFSRTAAKAGRLQLGRRHLALAGAGALGFSLAARSRAAAQAPPRTREIADMTWIEVRDAVAAGSRTVIVPTGGLEQNGPHMVIGKHDFIVHSRSESRQPSLPRSWRASPAA